MEIQILAITCLLVTVSHAVSGELCVDTGECQDRIPTRDLCDQPEELNFIHVNCRKFCGLCKYSRLDGGEGGMVTVASRAQCKDTTAEIAFVLDASSSVGEANFQKVRRFTQQVTQRLKAEYQKLNVTVITFSNEAQVLLQLNESVDVNAMVAAEGNITYTHGGTNTHKALTLAYNSFHLNVNSTKIAIVVTDGASFEPDLTRQAAANAKNHGVTIFVVAVGDDVNPHETKDVSSDPDDRYMRMLRSFNDLQSILGFFHIRNCTVTTTPPPTTTTTTEAPKTEPPTTERQTTVTEVPPTEPKTAPVTVTRVPVTNLPATPTAAPITAPSGKPPTAKPPFVKQTTTAFVEKTPGAVTGKTPTAVPNTQTGVQPSLKPPVGTPGKTVKPTLQTEPLTQKITTTEAPTPRPTTKPATTTTVPTTKTTTKATTTTTVPTTQTTTKVTTTTTVPTTQTTTKPTTTTTVPTTQTTTKPTTTTTIPTTKTTTQPTTTTTVTTTKTTTKPTTTSTTTQPTTTTTNPTTRTTTKPTTTTTVPTTKPTTKPTTTTTVPTTKPTTKPTTTTTVPTTKSTTKPTTTTTVLTTNPTTKPTTTTNVPTTIPTTKLTTTTTVQTTTRTTQPTTTTTVLTTKTTTKPTTTTAVPITQIVTQPTTTTKPTTTTTVPTMKPTTKPTATTTVPTAKSTSKPTTTTTVPTTNPTARPTTTTTVPTTKPTTKPTTTTTVPTTKPTTQTTTTTTVPTTKTTTKPTTTTAVPITQIVTQPTTTTTVSTTKSTTKPTTTMKSTPKPTTTTQEPTTKSTTKMTTTTDVPVTTTTQPPTTTTASCIAKIADVVFLVDTSGSIGLANFEKVKAFIKEVIMTFDVDSRYTRVGLIEYSTYAHLEFKLGEKTNQTELLDAVDNVTYSGGGTSTSDALQLMRVEGFQRERPAAPDIAIVITDGLSKFPSLTRAQANLAKADGITMFSIGIGNETASSELISIATDRRYVFQVGDYETLLTLDNVVAHRACGIDLPEEYHSRSTTTPSTTPFGCVDLDANCVNYPRDSCTDYEPYARRNCAKKCGYCPGQVITEPPCEDELDNCASYGTNMCSSSSQYEWVDKHCRKFCAFCGNKTDIAVTTQAPATTAPTTAALCFDLDPKCANYGGPGMCSQPTYEAWAKHNCRKYCNYCYSYHTVTSATVNHVRCPEWTLPEQCTLAYSADQCCPYPKCPDGFRLTVKRHVK